MSGEADRTVLLGDDRLPDPLVRVRPAAAPDPEALARQLEMGQVLVFDWPVLCTAEDLAFLRSLPVWPGRDRQVKKAKLRDLLVRPRSFGADPANPTLLEKLFPGDPATAARFRKLAGRVNTAFHAFRDRYFPRYRYTGEENHSWRLTETWAEGLHVDSYLDKDDEHYRLRIFGNYDDAPRVWRTTYKAPALLRRYFDSCRLEEVRDFHPNRVNDALNNRLPWTELPAQTILFPPGAVWVCDTQVVSHEIVYGRRGWGYTFTAESASLRDPRQSFQAQMRRTLAEIRTEKASMS